MAVDGLQSVGVAEDHVVTISFGLIVGEAHFAFESGVDCVVRTDVKVDTFVHATETGAVAIVGVDLAGNGNVISRHVDHFAVGHFRFAEGVDTLAVPSFGVDVELRLDVVDQVDKRALFYEADFVVG